MDNSSSSSPVTTSVLKKQATSTLLDITRAQNIGEYVFLQLAWCLINGLGIMLSRIKYSLPDIRQALLEINDEKLSIDDLKIIGKNLPSPEEV